MSKGSKRRSAKQIERDFNRIFEKPIVKARMVGKSQIKPWLSMTDTEIDQNYYHVGKAGRTRMKGEAATERLRLEVQAKLQQEE